MKKRVVVIAVLLVAALPAIGLGVQRFGRGRAGARAFAGASVAPAQVWRLTSLTMKQRVELHEIQMSAFERLRDARDGGADRRATGEAVRDAMSRVEHVLTP